MRTFTLCALAMWGRGGVCGVGWRGGGSVTREGKYYCAKALYNAFMELAVLP